MVNLLLKYFWMYMLLGVICNIGGAIALSFWICSSLRYDDDALEEVFSIILEIPGGLGLVHEMLRTKEGRIEYFKMFVMTQLIWPTNVAHVASKIPEAKAYILKWKAEHPLANEQP